MWTRVQPAADMAAAGGIIGSTAETVGVTVWDTPFYFLSKNRLNP